MKGRKRLILLALTFMFVAAAAHAQSHRNCAPRDAVIERLLQAYGETRQSIGLGRDNSMVEVFASQKSGSWTITVTSPTGLTCLIASGESFEQLEEAAPSLDKDA